MPPRTGRPRPAAGVAPDRRTSPCQRSRRRSPRGWPYASSCSAAASSGRRAPRLCIELTPVGREVSIELPPPEDRVTLSLDRRSQLLAGCPLFKGIDPDGLDLLANRATSVDF